MWGGRYGSLFRGKRAVHSGRGTAPIGELSGKSNFLLRSVCFSVLSGCFVRGAFIRTIVEKFDWVGGGSSRAWCAHPAPVCGAGAAIVLEALVEVFRGPRGLLAGDRCAAPCGSSLGDLLGGPFLGSVGTSTLAAPQCIEYLAPHAPGLCPLVLTPLFFAVLRTGVPPVLSRSERRAQLPSPRAPRSASDGNPFFRAVERGPGAPSHSGLSRGREQVRGEGTSIAASGAHRSSAAFVEKFLFRDKTTRNHSHFSIRSCTPVG